MSPGSRALVVLAAGVIAALNIGKLPPALPALREEFGLTLVQASWMLSLFQVAGALSGLFAGSLADRFGARRSMSGGMLLLGVASALGALATSPALLFASRALESAGFLLAVLPGPALLRRSVPAESLRGWLGRWGAYMPLGMGAALVVSPWLLEASGWRAVWVATGLLTAGWALAIRATQAPADRGAGPAEPLAALAAATLRSPGPWLLTLCFLFYAGQFVGIFGFLPTVYRDYGLDPRAGGALTAVAVLVNVSGNVAAGVLLQRGVQRSTLIVLASVVMAVCAWLAFGVEWSFAARFAAVLALSAVAGLIPGTLFATAPFYAPGPGAVSATVGLVQQGSAVGQILVPPVLAAIAQASGGWEWTWTATGACALATLAIGISIRRFDEKRLRRQTGAAG